MFALRSHSSCGGVAPVTQCMTTLTRCGGAWRSLAARHTSDLRVTALKRGEDPPEEAVRRRGRIPLSGSHPRLRNWKQPSKWRLSSEPAVGLRHKKSSLRLSQEKAANDDVFLQVHKHQVRWGFYERVCRRRALDRNVFLHYTSAAARCNNFPWKLGLDARFLMMESFDV